VKKFLLSTLLAAGASCPALAQRSYFGKAEVGFGRQTVRPAFDVQRARPTTQAVLSGGVAVKRLTVEIGFGVARSSHASSSGGRCGVGLQTEQVGVSSYYYPFAAHYTRLVMPVTLGYSLPLSKRLLLQPRLGLQGSYWTSAYYVAPLAGAEPIERTATGSVLRREVPAFSVAAQGGMHLQYRATPRVSVFGGPTYRYGLSAENKDGGALPGLRTSAVSVDAGVLLWLGDGSSRAAIKRP